MKDSIFKKIRSGIKRFFSKDKDPEVQEAPAAAQDAAETLSLDAASPEPLESRWTEEYVQFLEETDGGLPQPEEEEEAVWCDLPGEKEGPEEIPEDLSGEDPDMGSEETPDEDFEETPGEGTGEDEEKKE